MLYLPEANYALKLLSFLSWGPNALSPIVLALQAKRYLALSRARLQKNEKEKKKVRFLALLTSHTTMQNVLVNGGLLE